MGNGTGWQKGLIVAGLVIMSISFDRIRIFILLPGAFFQVTLRRHLTPHESEHVATGPVIEPTFHHMVRQKVEHVSLVGWKCDISLRKLHEALTECLLVFCTPAGLKRVLGSKS